MDFVHVVAASALIDATDRHDGASERHEVAAINAALAEVLFWWRVLDDHLKSGRAAPVGLSQELGDVRPGLVWARNLATHHALAVGRATYGRSYPRRYPLDYDERVTWRPLGDLPPPRGPAAWAAEQQAAYRAHLDGVRTAHSVDVIRRWARAL